MIVKFSRFILSKQARPPTFSPVYFRLRYQWISTTKHSLPHAERQSTTILCVRKGNQVCIAGDGMVSQGNMIVKPNARKVRRMLPNVILGFAGTTADCFTLFEKLEAKLEEFPDQLMRACVELAKQWRTDRYLKHLEAVLIVADPKVSLEVTGNGDVLESHDGVLGIGSGGPYAIAAARALYPIDNMSAKTIAYRSMQIAADICCHTNHNLTMEVIENGVYYEPAHKTGNSVTVNGESVQEMFFL